MFFFRKKITCPPLYHDVNLLAVNLWDRTAKDTRRLLFQTANTIKDIEKYQLNQNQHVNWLQNLML
jgi:hypothetical protein